MGNKLKMVEWSPASSWSPRGSSIMILDQGGDEVPEEGSDFTLSREQARVSLSINT